MNDAKIISRIDIPRREAPDIFFVRPNVADNTIRQSAITTAQNVIINVRDTNASVLISACRPSTVRTDAARQRIPRLQLQYVKACFYDFKNLSLETT